MCSSQCVLALLALYVGLAHSFSWDMAMISKHRIDFYFNGTLVHKEENLSRYYYNMIISDPLRNRVLFADEDRNRIYSFNTETETMQHILTLPNPNTDTPGMAYDPDSDQWFWADYSGMYSMSTTKPNTKIRAKYAKDIAVDTRSGYIYWTSHTKSGMPTINRARLDGSDEEILLTYEVFRHLQDLVIDPQTQRIYWTEIGENRHSWSPWTETTIIKSADLNGKNIKNLYEIEIKKQFGYYNTSKLAVSKDYIYWQQYSKHRAAIRGTLWQFNKNTNTWHPELVNTNDYMAITTNYKIEDHTPRIENAEALAGRPEESLDVPDASLLCIHGTPGGGESGCECDHGYTGERCEVFVCHNYCFGGKCTLSGDGLPTCRCYAGYTGQRCQTNVCNGYCLNDGVCSLTEYGRPVCKCTDGHKGKRCNVPTFLIKRYNVFSNLKDVVNADITMDIFDQWHFKEQDCPSYIG